MNATVIQSSSVVRPAYFCRAAVVYVRQSTMAQLTSNLESRRQSKI
jgi:hypothetical protein